MDGIIESIVTFLRDKLSDELIVFILSMSPILELRGGLIAGMLMGMKWYIALPICIIGNFIPIPFEMLFIRKIFDWLRRFKFMRKIVDKIDNKAHEKAKSKTMTKYKVWGLFIFVAIPLPGTGGWTGGLVADILDMRMKYAIPVIYLGIIVAGLISSLVFVFQGAF